MGTLSGRETLSLSFLYPFLVGSSHGSRFISLRVDPYLKGFRKWKQTGRHKNCFLFKIGGKIWWYIHLPYITREHPNTAKNGVLFDAV